MTTSTVAAHLSSLSDPEKAQRAVLERLLAHNAATGYGQDHGFAACKDYEAFAARSPIVTYEDLQPYIDRIIAGESRVLIADEVVYLATSSGTTARKKYIPIHRGFADETATWMALERHFLERAHPEVRDALELRYVNRVEEVLPSGMQVGSVSGWYYGELARAGAYQEVVPYEVYQIPGVLGRNYAVLRFALASPAIGQMGAVNPSTLLLLTQQLAKDGEALVRDVRDGGLRHPEIPADRYPAARLPPDPERARMLEAALRRDGTLKPKAAWPELRLLSCWINAGAGLYRADLKTAFGDGVAVWDYGYTSTEGRVTVTVDDEGAGIPLLTSVFLELRREDGTVVPLFAASPQETGELIVTNSRGLYRYTMGDVVTVSGFEQRTPLLRFRRKTTAVASLTGEKLTEEQVVRVVERALAALSVKARYFCLAPTWGQPPRYLLMCEADGAWIPEAREQELLATIEQGLFEVNAEYERKRETLRLAPLGLLVLRPGELDRYLARLTAGGRELARIKIPRVTMDVELAKGFVGRLVEPAANRAGKEHGE